MRLLDATERSDVWKRNHDGKRERDRLLLALFASAGLRRSELLGLDWHDVDLERRLLKVRKAKGGRQRTLPIHPALEPLFVDYRKIRSGDAEAALFAAKASLITRDAAVRAACLNFVALRHGQASTRAAEQLAS